MLNGDTVNKITPIDIYIKNHPKVDYVNSCMYNKPKL